jgi:hypothetical protein
MGRRVQSNVGLRGLLIADRKRSLERWAIPGKPDEFLVALRAGAPVVLSSAQLLQALSRAGLPCDEFAFGGRGYDKTLVLGTNDYGGG